MKSLKLLMKISMVLLVTQGVLEGFLFRRSTALPFVQEAIIKCKQASEKFSKIRKTKSLYKDVRNEKNAWFIGDPSDKNIKLHKKYLEDKITFANTSDESIKKVYKSIKVDCLCSKLLVSSRTKKHFLRKLYSVKLGTNMNECKILNMGFPRKRRYEFKIIARKKHKASLQNRKKINFICDFLKNVKNLEKRNRSKLFFLVGSCFKKTPLVTLSMKKCGSTDTIDFLTFKKFLKKTIEASRNSNSTMNSTYRHRRTLKNENKQESKTPFLDETLSTKSLPQTNTSHVGISTNISMKVLLLPKVSPSVLIFNSIINPSITLLTLITNLMVCVVLLKKNMINATNAVLVSIAISDTLTGLLPLPIYVYFYSLENYKDYVPFQACYIYETLMSTLPTGT